MSSALNPSFSFQDIELLKEASSDPVKIDLIKKLQANFKLNHLDEEERLIAEEILRLLAADISIRIREHIATKFCDNLALPNDIALILAYDLEDIVALPIIQNSNVLTDANLIAIIQSGNYKRQQAIATRRQLSEEVCNHIVTFAVPKAVETLISNNKVSFTRKQSEWVITTYASDQSIIRALISNKKIQPEQVYELLAKVSEDLQKMLIVTYNIPKTAVNNIIHDSKEWMLMNLILCHSEKRGNISLTQIIENLAATNGLTFSLLVKTLSLGDLTFFGAAMAKLAGIPAENAHKLIVSEDFASFKALYEKCALPAMMLDAVYRLALIAAAEKAKPATEKNGTEKLHHRILFSLSKAANENGASSLDYLVTIIDFSLRKANLL